MSYICEYQLVSPGALQPQPMQRPLNNLTTFLLSQEMAWLGKQGPELNIRSNIAPASGLVDVVALAVLGLDI